MNRVLEFIIRAKDSTATGLNAVRDRIANFAKSAARNLANIQAGFQMASRSIISTAQSVWSAVKESFRFETLTVQFRTLIGDMEQARDHMKMLKELGDTPPFSLEEFARASRELMVMSEGALGYRKSLVLVGDAAAATGLSLDTLSHAVGRAYALIRDGQPMERAAMELRNMGIITPQLAEEMAGLQKAGASNIEVWNKLEDALRKHQGAMDQTLKTGNGMAAALETEWTNAIRQVGDAFRDSATEGIGSLHQKLKALNDDGSFARWADATAAGFQLVGNAAKGAWDKVKGSLVVSSFRDVAVEAGSRIAEWTSRAQGNSKEDAAAARHTFYAMYASDYSRANAVERLGYDPKAEHEQMVRAEKKIVKSASENGKDVVEENRIADEMAEAQRRTDSNRLDAAARKEMDELEKFLDEEEKAWAALQEKELAAIRAQQDERRRLQDEADRAAHARRVEDVRAEAAAGEQAQAAAADRLARARAAADQAWSWYRDPEAFRARLKEERADEEARKRFTRDEDRLTRMRGWRTRELSDDQEAVRRVVLAREEERRAEQALAAIEKNTAGLEAMLRTLLTSK